MIRFRLSALLFLSLLAAFSGVRVAQTACPLTPQLTVGGRGVVLGTSPNNLRSGPSRTEAVIAEIPGGGIFTVLGGPECDSGGGINWWQVDYAGQVGWTAEGDTSGYFVEPLHPALLYRAMDYNAPVGEDGRTDLALYDLVTGENTILTADLPDRLSGEDVWRLWNFAWTPEQDRIAFTAEIYTPFQSTRDISTYRMNMDGSGKCLLAENAELMDTGSLATRPVPPGDEDGAPFDFPPCENPPNLAPSYWRIEIEGQAAFAVNEVGERIQLTTRDMGRASYGGVISPDGTLAAVNVLDEDYDTTLYLIPLASPESAAPLTLTSAPTGGLIWSPDGAFLLVSGEDEGEYKTTLTRVNVGTGQEQILYTGFTASLPLASPIYDPAGTQIAFAGAAEVEPGVIEPRLYVMNADGTQLQQLDTLASFGPILWRAA